MISDEVRDFLKKIGRNGGQKVTEKKLESLAKARKAKKQKRSAARAEESK